MKHPHKTHELEITFLGTGTSTGVPMVGCDCEVCQSTDPHDKRERASIYVRSPELTWVVDTGPDFRSQFLREKISQLDAVLITHEHTDHIMGFDDLRRFTFEENQTIPVYATEETLTALRRVFHFAFTGENRFRGYLKPDARPVFDQFLLGKTAVQVLPVEHGRVETVGFMFSREDRALAAYICDCKRVPEPTIAALKGVDTLILNCLRRREHPTHLTVDESLEIIREVKPRRAYLTHMSHELSHAELESSLPPGVHVAYDGLKLHW